MYSWLVGQYVRFLVRRLLAGDVDLLVKQFSPKIEFIFPGRNSFAGTYHGREQVSEWLRRFLSLKPEYIVRDVLVSGMPWNTRIAYRLSDRIGEHYSNEGVVYLHFRWFQATHFRVFLDTERISEWERDHPDEMAVPRLTVGAGVHGR
jgi:ketosteroid isomerase-like protein